MINDLLNAIKSSLTNEFNEQILKYILIGSRLNNSQKDNSDFDIILITANNVNAYDFIKKSTDYIMEISFSYNSIIGIYPIKEKNLNQNNSQFINNIISNGIEF